MADPELEKAWSDVHENTPEGWYVGKPDYEDHYRQWSMYTFDPKEKAVVGGRERQWIAVGSAESESVRDTAYSLGGLKAGRWPM